jgi:hypothetical protein
MKLLSAGGVVLLLSGLSAVVLTYMSNPSDFSSNLFDPLVLLTALGPVVLSVISLRLARVPLQKVHVRVIAAVFLIVALSVPATFYYADQTAEIGCLCSIERPIMVTITGGILVTPTGSGNLTIRVWDSTVDPISRISVVNSSDLPGAIAIAFYFDGSAVGPSNMLPAGNMSTSSLQIGNVTAGVTYTIEMVIMYQNQGQVLQILDMTAQET